MQQQLSEINHRYQIIGVKLSDRQRDLDGLADEVKRHHDTIKSLLAFVQTKVTYTYTIPFYLDYMLYQYKLDKRAKMLFRDTVSNSRK